MVVFTTVTEAIREIEGTVENNRDAVSRILAAGMIADATNNLAKAKQEQVDMHKDLMEKMSPLMDMYAGMVAKMGPAIDASMDALKDEMDGERWKRGMGDED